MTRVTFDEYVRRLQDGAGSVATGDLRALSGLVRPQAEMLAAAWPNIALPRRRQLVHLMAELAEDNVDLDYSAAFKVALTDEDDEVRRQAAEGLWEDEEIATADTLVEVLKKDPAPAVRAAVATTLSHFVCRLELADLDQGTGNNVKTALYDVYDDQTEPLEVRRRALEAVSYLSENRAREAIARGYADRAPKMRASAVFAMGRSCDRRWLPAVLSELQSDNAEMRFEAARASGELEDERAVAPLIELIGDADREVRVAAVAALGLIGGDQAKRAIRTALQSPDAAVAAAAEEALEELEVTEDVFQIPGPDTSDE